MLDILLLLLLLLWWWQYRRGLLFRVVPGGSRNGRGKVGSALLRLFQRRRGEGMVDHVHPLLAMVR